MKYLQMLKAMNDLVESHKRYTKTCHKFEQKTGCGSLYDDYIHIREVGARDLTLTLKIEVKEEFFDDDYHKYVFEFQGVKFLWLERREEKDW